MISSLDFRSDGNPLWERDRISRYQFFTSVLYRVLVAARSYYRSILLFLRSPVPYRATLLFFFRTFLVPGERLPFPV